jgi:subtilisin family serine protease
MRRFDKVFLWSAVLVCAFLFITATQSAENRDAASTRVISPGLQKQLESAAPDELVTAIVRVRDVGPPASAQASQGRAAVFSALRQSAGASQRGVIDFLDQASVRSRRGVVRSFWLDNLVLVQAPRDVIDQIARRPDVTEVFENFTVTLPPKAPGDGIMRTHQSQPWDNIAHIGAKQVWQSYGLTGSGVRVGGLDTGVDISHPDIAGKMVTNNPADPTSTGPTPPGP